MSFVLVQVIDEVKVCRVCLAVDVKMHNLRNDYLKTYFESVIGIPIKNTMQLPMFLCFECAGLVRKFSIFKKRCLRGQTILLGFRQNGIQLTQQVVNNIDRQHSLLYSPLNTTNVETIEYNPLNDNYTETQTIDQNKVKEEPIIPVDIELELLDDNHGLKLDDVFQDAAHSSDDEPLTNKVKTKKLAQEEKSGQEYLNVLTDDFVQILIKSEPESLPKTTSICHKIQSKKSDVVETRNKEKPAKTGVQSRRISTKSQKTSVESPKTSVKSKRISVRSKRTSAKSQRISANSPITNSKSLTRCVKSQSTTTRVDSPTTRVESPTTRAVSLTASAKSPKSAETVVDDVYNGDDDDDNKLVEYEIIDLTLGQQFEEIEKRKESENYLHSPFKCDLCYRGFADIKTYTNHTRKHDPSAGDFECEICKCRFATKRAYQKHVANHERKYACKGCSYVCTSVTAAKLHQNFHKGVLYKCEICDKVSMRQNSHLSHMRKKHPSKYICDVCGYSFVSEQGVTQHKSMMHKDIMVEADAKADQESGQSGTYCEECDVKFVSLEAYNRHMVTSTKHSINFSGGCQTCGARFPTAEELRAHRKNHHPGQRNHYGAYTTRKKYYQKKKPSSRTFPATCEHCPEVIPNAREYWNHFRRAHPGIPYPISRDYVCDVCGKGFRGNAFLTYHKRTHSSERQFSCETCGKSFYNRMNLVTHVRTHSDAQPHACKLCSKVFKFASNLTRHYRIHNGAKPYECGICGKSFSQSNSRNVHIRTVHLKEPPPYLSKARLEKKKQSKKESN